MKKINTQRGIAPILVLLILVLIAGGGIYVAEKNGAKKAKTEETNVQATSTTSVSTTTPAVATTTERTLQINLNQQNKSGQSGKAVITEADGKLKVILNITGKPSTVAEPAHIHLGACSKIGAVKYPLTSVSKGASQTMLDITMDQLLSQLPLSINVHKSAADIGTYVACGDISTSTIHTSASTSVEVKASAVVR